MTVADSEGNLAVSPSSAAAPTAEATRRCGCCPSQLRDPNRHRRRVRAGLGRQLSYAAGLLGGLHAGIILLAAGTSGPGSWPRRSRDQGQFLIRVRTGNRGRASPS